MFIYWRLLMRAAEVCFMIAPDERHAAESAEAMRAARAFTRVPVAAAERHAFFTCCRFAIDIISRHDADFSLLSANIF